MVVYTGLRLSQHQAERAGALASQLGISRNRLFGLLIESANIESQPIVGVGLKNNKSVIAPVESDNHAFAKSL